MKLTLNTRVNAPHMIKVYSPSGTNFRNASSVDAFSVNDRLRYRIGCEPKSSDEYASKAAFASDWTSSHWYLWLISNRLMSLSLVSFLKWPKKFLNLSLEAFALEKVKFGSLQYQSISEFALSLCAQHKEKWGIFLVFENIWHGIKAYCWNASCACFSSLYFDKALSKAGSARGAPFSMNLLVHSMMLPRYRY